MLFSLFTLQVRQHAFFKDIDMESLEVRIVISAVGYLVGNSCAVAFSEIQDLVAVKEDKLSVVVATNA